MKVLDSGIPYNKWIVLTATRGIIDRGILIRIVAPSNIRLSLIFMSKYEIQYINMLKSMTVIRVYRMISF